jgi:FixJ family two-component response regulator
MVLPMEKAPIVHVIDDDPSIRKSIEALLRSVNIPVHSFESPRAFLDSAVADLTGCLLLDVRLPGVSGLDFQSQLESLGIGLPVIMMTAHGDIPMSVRAMKAGAVDFLPKPFRDQDLIDAVYQAFETDRLATAVRIEVAEIELRYATLSVREQQVMSLVTRGKLNKQAAFELGLSEITVKIHRASAMRKMEARTLADFVKISERLAGAMKRHPEMSSLR